jgi:hypothetical protein
MPVEHADANRRRQPDASVWPRSQRIDVVAGHPVRRGELRPAGPVVALQSTRGDPDGCCKYWTYGALWLGNRVAEGSCEGIKVTLPLGGESDRRRWRCVSTPLFAAVLLTLCSSVEPNAAAVSVMARAGMVLYLDAFAPGGRGESIYLDMLEAVRHALVPGSLVLAHNSINSAQDLADCLACVRDPSQFRQSVNVYLDPEGL